MEIQATQTPLLKMRIKTEEEDDQNLRINMEVEERNILILQTVHGEEIRQMELVAEVEEEMVDHQMTEAEEEMADHQMVDPMMEIINWMLEKVKENWH